MMRAATPRFAGLVILIVLLLGYTVFLAHYVGAYAPALTHPVI
jgi:hypothetical protein